MSVSIPLCEYHLLASLFLIICDLQDKNGSAARRKAISDYKLEGDGHSHDPNENAVSGLSDDTVKGSRNQTRHISDGRSDEIPLLTTEVTLSLFLFDF